MPSTSFCPYCIWAACGLVILLTFPDLTAVAGSVGPLWLWLVAIPVASALLRRIPKHIVHS